MGPNTPSESEEQTSQTPEPITRDDLIKGLAEFYGQIIDEVDRSNEQSQTSEDSANFPDGLPW